MRACCRAKNRPFLSSSLRLSTLGSSCSLPSSFYVGSDCQREGCSHRKCVLFLARRDAGDLGRGVANQGAVVASRESGVGRFPFVVPTNG